MSKQYNKTEKKMRRNSYLKRKKVAAKTKSKTKTPAKADAAK